MTTGSDPSGGSPDAGGRKKANEYCKVEVQYLCL
jgi:hypothetical protein